MILSNPSKPTLAMGDKDQRSSFESAARDIDADQSPEALDRAFGKLDPRRNPDEKSERGGGQG